jgi:hypothetical protein
MVKFASHRLQGIAGRSNIQHRIMYAARRELLCRTVYFIIKRLSDLSGRSRRRSLKRFHTSTFCGSIFDILRFAFNAVSQERRHRPEQGAD